MSQSAETIQPVVADTTPSGRLSPAGTGQPTDSPIPLWPEGVLVAAAGVVLLVVALRHRVYLMRKYQDLKRAADEFQRQGGLEDLQQVARQAQELLKMPEK